MHLTSAANTPTTMSIMIVLVSISYRYHDDHGSVSVVLQRFIRHALPTHMILTITLLNLVLAIVM